MERASPVDMQKYLMLVETMKDAGIGFIPIPIINDGDELYKELLRKLSIIENDGE